MIKYQKWILKNTYSLEGKLVLFVGATGTIGKALLKDLLFLRAKIIMGARNLEKAQKLKEEMLLFFPKADINVLYLDLSNLESIDTFQAEIDKNYNKIDYFINNAGVYHLPSSTSAQGYEIHFATNTLGSFYLTKKIAYDLREDAKIIYTGSLSYKFNEIDFNDIQALNQKSKIKIYGLTKQIMMLNAMALKDHTANTKITINVCHPGIVPTALFRSHGKMFKIFVMPLMRLIFQSPERSALSLLAAMFMKTNIGEWVGPRGLFGVWGYPKVSKLKKKMKNKELYEKCYSICNNLIMKQNVR